MYVCMCVCMCNINNYNFYSVINPCNVLIESWKINQNVTL